MAQVILDVKQPTLSLLNIGEEEIKGLDEIKSSHEMLKSTEYFFRYKGFIEIRLVKVFQTLLLQMALQEILH